MKKKIVIGLSVIVVLVTMAMVQTDKRIVGSYRTDTIQSHSRWTIGKSIDAGSVGQVLHQIFQNQPIYFSTRTIVHSTEDGIITNSYRVLWKGKSSCFIATSAIDLFRIEYTDDGLWLERKFTLPLEDFPLIVKMVRNDDTATTSCIPVTRDTPP